MNLNLKNDLEGIIYEDYLRDQIDKAKIGHDLDPNSQLVKDIKSRMHQHIDHILELEEQKIEISRKIKDERKMLKDLAKKWNV